MTSSTSKCCPATEVHHALTLRANFDHDDEHDHENDHDSNHSRSLDIPDILAGATLGPPPPRHYVSFLEDYYPSFKRKCTTLLQQIMVSTDKDDISAALHSMLDKAPLVAYLVVKDVR